MVVGDGQSAAAEWCRVCPSCAVFIRNKSGETAKDIARKFGQVDCLAVLGGDKGEELKCCLLCIAARVMWKQEEVDSSILDLCAYARCFKLLYTNVCT